MIEKAGPELFRHSLKSAKTRPSKIAEARRSVEENHLHAAVHHLYDRFPQQSARHRFDGRQKRLLIGALLIFTAMVVIWPIPVLILLNTVFLCHGLTVLLVRSVFLYLSIYDRRQKLPRTKLADVDLPIITILCPMYREEKSLPGLVQALQSMDYPQDRMDVKILLEEDDLQTISAAKRLCAHDPFDIVLTPPSDPRTKPKACNFALWSSLGDIIVIYDAEDRPEPHQLRLAAETFAALPDNIACLQARLNYYNRDRSIITRLFAIEYALLFDLVLPALDRIGAPLPLGGTSNFFRTHHLIAVGAWDPFNVTEDADLGLRLAAAGLSSRMLNATTYEEATSTAGPWIKQRSRWIKGYLQTWIVQARRQNAHQPWTFHLTLHFIVGTVVISALFNPIFWILYVIWASGLGAWTNILFPGPLATLATFLLLAGNLFHVWLFMLAPMRRQWHDLVPFALLAPLYWMLQSIAGYKAFWQFLTRPFYWEKTEHGQSLPQSDDILSNTLKST